MNSFLRIPVICLALFLVVSAVQAVDMENVLEDAKVGEWVSYKMPQANGMTTKQTIVKITKDEIVLKVETKMPGMDLPPTEIKIPKKLTGLSILVSGGLLPAYESPDYKGPKPKVSKGQIEVKGKKIDCYIVEMDMASGQKVKSYMSNSIPVSGLIKVEINRKVSMELVDYGTK